MYELKIPIPDNEKDFLWFALGLQFGRSFGKQLDQNIQSGEWFAELKPWKQDVVKRLLDFTHHWWVGYILWAYASIISAWIGFPQLTNEIFWFGVGLLVDDLPDLAMRIQGGVKNILEYMKKNANA